MGIWFSGDVASQGAPILLLVTLGQDALLVHGSSDLGFDDLLVIGECIQPNLGYLHPGLGRLPIGVLLVLDQVGGR